MRVPQPWRKPAKLPAAPASTPEARQARLDALLRHDWVVYAKTPPAGPEVVLDYLSRYTHRLAISNQRIVAIDECGMGVISRVARLKPGDRARSARQTCESPGRGCRAS